jgi:DNA-binding response OmpR family regulator
MTSNYRPRILVVDDDRQLCTFLGELLDTAGFDVGLAHGYDEALEAIHVRRYDHVLVDFFYPQDPDRMDGVDVMRAVKTVSPASRVYLMTGLPPHGVGPPGITLGFDGFLAKPFSLATIRSLLQV